MKQNIFKALNLVKLITKNTNVNRSKKIFESVIWVALNSWAKTVHPGGFAPKPHAVENAVKELNQTAGARTCKHFERPLLYVSCLQAIKKDKNSISTKILSEQNRANIEMERSKIWITNRQLTFLKCHRLRTDVHRILIPPASITTSFFYKN